MEVVPFLRWPGGKRWLVPHIRRLLDGRHFRSYWEPFLGGGALFFALKPEQATLSDLNGELINAYVQVKRHPSLLVEQLKTLPVTKKTYESMRRSVPDRRLDKAVRFLYLNRTAFSGMYRVNRLGQFNVPYGGGLRTPSPLWTKKLLVEASATLRRTRLLHQDFEVALTDSQPGDLVYCDPTYTVSHNNNGFVKYNERIFSWRDQVRLAVAAESAAKRGVTVLVSNAHHEDLINLYPTAQHIVLTRQNLLSPLSHRRRLMTEFLFVLASNGLPVG